MKSLGLDDPRYFPYLSPPPPQVGDFVDCRILLLYEYGIYVIVFFVRDFRYDASLRITAVVSNEGKKKRQCCVCTKYVLFYNRTCLLRCMPILLLLLLLERRPPAEPQGCAGNSRAPGCHGRRFCRGCSRFFVETTTALTRRRSARRRAGAVSSSPPSSS